jgi:flagellar biosynthesis anti-sigma factor FlgM
MKIDDRNQLGALSTSGPAGAAGVESGSQRTTSGAASGSSSDTAELSGLAGKISQDSADRAAKVEHLRAQVANGTYQPNSAAIGHGIVNEALASAAAAGGAGKK